MFKKSLLFISLFAVSALFAWSQPWRSTPYEVYGGMGFSNYFGDIGGTSDEDNLYGLKDFELFQTRPSINAGLRYNFHYFFSLNTAITLGWLSGDDEGGRNEARGYTFNTLFFEPSTRIEFSFLKDYPFRTRRTDRRGRIASYSTLSAYAFGGFGGIFFHVMPNEALKERRETSNIEHGNAALVIPAGIGLRLGISYETDLGIEIGGRYTTSDYIDGFTSNFSKHNDIYYITTINLIYRFNEFPFRQ